MSLAEQRCWSHVEREAVARCPACQRFFCRECITEHDDRVICAACLGKLVPSPPPPHGAVRRLGPWLGGLAGFLIIWFCFYLLGHLLLSIPAEFHEGTVWRTEASP